MADEFTFSRSQLQILVAAILASGTMVADPGRPITALTRYAAILKIIREKGLNPL